MVQVDGHKLEVLVDTGSRITIMLRKEYDQIPDKSSLQPSRIIPGAYGGQKNQHERAFEDSINFQELFKIEPVRKLTKKNVDFEWSDDCESCMHVLKEEIQKAPSLKSFDESLRSVVTRDESQIGLGVVSQQKPQESQLIAFESRKLKKPET
ncbi:hypothetical protein NDU88_003869 [Pleurodeles waltl]|uniref:Reverse transcriptase/retrotransposon-derived protein RNase H-like domain-containing protein n=1 Tax=Pleurodeles waltl TaxID=8319 RepID=A0AAV7MZU7_PLEWA|nr:hypothetical protein NDU88_003869 [Pleurodeles waltl]